jgi:hypothetical protein
MSYKVTVGNAVLEKCIESVQFNVSTPSDYIFTSRCNNKNLIKVTGNIDTEESTVVLYEWALLPATNPECYKEMIIEHYKEEKLLRKVTFSKAFVVKYSESYSNDKGVGTFTLYIKPFFGQDIEVTGEMSPLSSTAKPNSIHEIEEEKQNQNDEQKHNTNNSTLSKEGVLSFTKRLEKQKEKSDNITIVEYGEHLTKDEKRRKVLKSNVQYTTPEGYTYRTDELGRIVSCEGTLKKGLAERNEYAQRIVGREDRLPDDEGGHLIASIFKGSGDIDNLVPMNANLNKGEWKKLENSWKDALEATPPQEVQVMISPIYEGNSQRPAKFKIKYRIGNENNFTTKFLKNAPGGN